MQVMPPPMRRIQGELVLPPDAAPAVAERVSVELRDVSWMDRPSRLLAATSLQGVAVGPGVRLPFSLEAPQGQAGDSLSLRAQIDLRGGAGCDYLTTASQPVAPTGDVQGQVVRLARP